MLYTSDFELDEPDDFCLVIVAVLARVHVVPRVLSMRKEMLPKVHVRGVDPVYYVHGSRACYFLPDDPYNFCRVRCVSYDMWLWTTREWKG